MDAGRDLMRRLGPFLPHGGHRALEAHDGVAMGANVNGAL
jgi:hypothetical protein